MKNIEQNSFFFFLILNIKRLIFQGILYREYEFDYFKFFEIPRII